MSILFLLFFFLLLLPSLKRIACINNMLSQFLQRPGIFDFEITNARAAQRGEAGAVAQGLTEIVGEAADLGAFAARHLEIQFWETVEVKFEVVDADITGF